MRNIIMLSVDSLRAESCGFMGYDRNTTPFLSNPPCNQLIFDNAIAPSCWTLPSMAGVHSGKLLHDYPSSMSEKHRWAQRELSTRTMIADDLSERGWNTAAYSPNPHASPSTGFNSGFNRFEQYEGSSQTLPKPLKTISQFLRGDAGFTKSSQQLEDILSSTPEEPFFIWAFPLDTHIPFQSDKLSRKYSTLLDEISINLYSWNKIGGGDDYGRTSFSGFNRDRLVNLYDDSIRTVDKFVEELWNQLKEYDPIIILFGDHGEGFGQHGYYSHARELYDELIHVPLTVLNSDLKGYIKKPFSLLDLKDILLEMAEDKLDWSSIPTRQYTLSKVFSNKDRKIAIRGTQFKYIWKSKDDDELYNLNSDRKEQKNLLKTASDAKFEEIATHVRASEERELIRYVSNKVH